MADQIRPEEPEIRAEGEATLKIDRRGQRTRVTSSHLEITVGETTSVSVSGTGGTEPPVGSSDLSVTRFVTRTVDAIERVQLREERLTAPLVSNFKEKEPLPNLRIFPDGSVPCPLCEVGWLGEERTVFGDCLLCHGVGRVMPRTRSRFLTGSDDVDPDAGEEPQLAPGGPGA